LYHKHVHQRYSEEIGTFQRPGCKEYTEVLCTFWYGLHLSNLIVMLTVALLSGDIVIAVYIIRVYTCFYIVVSYLMRSGHPLLCSAFYYIWTLNMAAVYIHSVTIKFPNWRYYSNTTNFNWRGWTGIVTKKVYLYDVQVSTCLVDAYEDYSCFGEVNFFVVSKVSKWNKEHRLSKQLQSPHLKTETDPVSETLCSSVFVEYWMMDRVQTPNSPEFLKCFKIFLKYHAMNIMVGWSILKIIKGCS
jgi:hypothetical protein